MLLLYMLSAGTSLKLNLITLLSISKNFFKVETFTGSCFVILDTTSGFLGPLVFTLALFLKLGEADMSCSLSVCNFLSSNLLSSIVLVMRKEFIGVCTVNLLPGVKILLALTN